MRSSTLSAAIKHYFKNTTLHGFKYLCSLHSVDRIGWLVCCCASACCAGVLCAVLWARFLEVPALLALWDDLRTDAYVNERLPAVAVCPPTESVAEMFLSKLSPNATLTKRIPITLARLLTGKPTALDQLQLLDNLLTENNVTLPQLMMEYTHKCNQHARKCRYQKIKVPCEHLFEKELTTWGLCCVMRPKKLANLSANLAAQSHTTQMLDFVLQCTHGSRLYGCQFIPLFRGEEWVQPIKLLPSYFYMAQLRFTALTENHNNEQLMEKTCVHEKSYTRSVCMLKCAEEACGCKDPLHSKNMNTENDLPLCPLTRLSCLRSNGYLKISGNASCQCLPSCRKITTYMALESNPISGIQNAIDPIYSGLNVTPSIVVNLRVNVANSRVFVVNPTETWLTLLSSLGGVFNMFLGVGLFSFLELLYLIVIKLPIAIRKSSEIDPTAARTT